MNKKTKKTNKAEQNLWLSSNNKTRLSKRCPTSVFLVCTSEDQLCLLNTGEAHMSWITLTRLWRGFKSMFMQVLGHSPGTMNASILKVIIRTVLGVTNTHLVLHVLTMATKVFLCDSLWISNSVPTSEPGNRMNLPRSCALAPGPPPLSNSEDRFPSDLVCIRKMTIFS